MSGRGYKIAVADGRTWPMAVFLLALATGSAPGCAQVATQSPAPAVAPVNGATEVSPLGEQVTLDHVVAIVNNDLILESDVEAEQRFAAFQPFSDSKPITRDQLIDRLIDRALILQQMALQPGPPITDTELDDELDALRKAIPRCAAYRCVTKAGWEKFVGDQGFTLEEMRERWRQRMDVLRFIDERFRMGIPVPPTEVDDYYKKTMLPQYQKENVAPPAEAAIADRIQEILLQQRVDKLLDDWLTSLRAQGSVRILKPGEEAP